MDQGFEYRYLFQLSSTANWLQCLWAVIPNSTAYVDASLYCMFVMSREQ